MAGKRITDLTLAPLLYPIDFIPVARDTQTMRVAGSAVVASHIYEPHRIVNEFSSQKYFLAEEGGFTILPSMNNGKIVITGSQIDVSFANELNSPFELGFEFELFSAFSKAVHINLPRKDIGYYYKVNGSSFLTTGVLYGGAIESLNPYESVRIVHLAPGIWTIVSQGNAAIETSIVTLPEVNVIDNLVVPTIVIATSGVPLDLTSIDEVNTYASIANSSVTFVSINGASAYGK